MTADHSTPRHRVDAKAIEQRAAEWLACRDAYADDEYWDDAKEAQFEAWLAESTHHRVAYLRLENAWDKANRLRVHRHADTRVRDAVEADGDSRALMPATKRVASRRLLVGVAAALMLAFSFVAVREALLPATPVTQLHATALGERAVITLADGSRLTLNTDTRVRSDLSGRTRQLWLDQGEAYFEVAHDADRPFIVAVGDKQVRVVGTRFSLRREGDVLQTRVVEGRVRVSATTGASTLLSADDAADVTDSAVRVRKKTSTEMASDMTWLQGMLRLDGMTLQKAATEFNRYNRRKLQVADAQAGAIVIGGTFDAHNVDGFAGLLETGFGLEAERRDDRIIITVRR